ncbi:cytochrome d ubiquinol oxidase subunit II [Cereibacter azotoformans]|uniref:Cytochrome bd-I ubiquinol oxidase subunit 2 apoprotein n=1 Tax=Cereibacter azotoformans TaxID=43057 RepID=A0A2T5K630_9RHOB|nr:cytochrome d ubiquinol oxidase subunit II [Cereibacter azotoformans]AXQ95777.1 cytochrome d ubiquinol oxidase subunit II [Cereibacter sphaeroides]PTR17887.1 cytochrome bd-I ubiquinol oxidase subunit 2 apoprotein [Cereibacter azotoformans]UIJ32718.1 cytochrome d ubiquinol oxidase subunit II [Cereibacter azotoformans]
MLGLELSFIWAGIIAFAVLVYVILDGFDLGVGILFPFAKDERERDVMMNSVAPIWDGNETWLVLGGGGLFAVFPLAYAVVMPALYVPIIAMLLALIFRGVAFEYRWRTVRWKRLWDWAFFGGSLVAGLSQGIALGALVQGIEVENRAYAGGWFDWFTPFSLLTGLAVATGYALLGATWCNMKLEGRVQEHMRRLARPLALATLGFLGLVSLFTPLQDAVYAERWFRWPTMVWSLAVPVLVALAAWRLWRGLEQGDDRAPFLCALGFFVLGFVGIGISFYPMMVPPELTIVEAAAPDESLLFTLVGTVVMVPIILAYTAYTYWVFRGKIDPDEGYH